MEYLSGTLGLLSAAFGSLSSAQDLFTTVGETAYGIVDTVLDAMKTDDKTWKDKLKDVAKDMVFGKSGNGALGAAQSIINVLKNKN